MSKSYSELIALPTMKDRFEYLKIGGAVGAATFGGRRYLNQIFYSTSEWKNVRKWVIARDSGLDLGLDGYEIEGRIFVHHMYPITEEDVIYRNPRILDPEYLISVSRAVHAAIHYGDESLLPKDPICRFPNDTCPWKN